MHFKSFFAYALTAAAGFGQLVSVRASFTTDPWYFLVKAYRLRVPFDGGS